MAPPRLTSQRCSAPPRLGPLQYLGYAAGDAANPHGTNRMAACQHCWKEWPTAEIVARVQEAAWDRLRRPAVRIAAGDGIIGAQRAG